MALYTRTIFNPSQTTWLILAPMTIDYSKFFTIPVLLQKKMKKPSQHIYFLFTIRHIFPKIIMSQISLFKSPENKRRKQQKCLSLYITWHIRNTFDIQKKNISFDYSSHLSTSLCIKRQLDRYSVFFSSCYLFCICRIYCCK